MCVFRMPYSVSSILGFVIKWQINAVKERKINLLPSGCPTAYIPLMHIQIEQLSYISMPTRLRRSGAHSCRGGHPPGFDSQSGIARVWHRGFSPEGCRGVCVCVCIGVCACVIPGRRVIGLPGSPSALSARSA